MAFKTTHASRYSFGYVNSTQTITDKDPGDTDVCVSFGMPIALSTSEVPASSTSAGVPGQLAFDSDNVFLYTSDNSWVVISNYSLF